MGKPFKIAGTQPRDGSGRYTQPTPPAPPKVVDSARSKGVNTDAEVAEVAVTDHPTPGGQSRGEERPWPEAGPMNDAANKPMRLG